MHAEALPKGKKCPVVDCDLEDFFGTYLDELNTVHQKQLESLVTRSFQKLA